MSRTPKPPYACPAQASEQNSAMKQTAKETAQNWHERGRKSDEKVVDFQEVSPLSMASKKKEADFETARKRVFGRGSPEGEDTKQITNILNHLNSAKPKITVHEFVNLVFKFTCDNGQTMREVLEDDLASFRRMVTEVYENMTEDVSDVLVNEQIQTLQFYQDRYDMFSEKTMRMMSEIFQLVPDFDFEKYAEDKEEFLKLVCPTPELVKVQSDDGEVQKRQEVFDKLQWLKTEGKRLAEENSRLEERLEELQKLNKKETTLASIKTSMMQRKMRDLENEELEKQEHLRELADTLDENIVRTAAFFRPEEDAGLARPGEGKNRCSDNKADLDWSCPTARIVEKRALKETIERRNTFADQKKSARS